MSKPYRLYAAVSLLILTFVMIRFGFGMVHEPVISFRNIRWIVTRIIGVNINTITGISYD